MQSLKAWRESLQKSIQGLGLPLVGLVLVTTLPLLLVGSGATWMVIDQRVATVIALMALLLASGIWRRILRTCQDFGVALRESGAHLQAPLDQFSDLVARLPVGLYRYRMMPDGGGRFDFVSALFCAQVRATQEQILQDPKTAFECFTPKTCKH